MIAFVTGQGVTAPPGPTGGYPMEGVFPESVAAVSFEVDGQDLELLLQGQAPFTAGVMQMKARFGSNTGAHIVRVRIGEAVSQAGVVVWGGH